MEILALQRGGAPESGANDSRPFQVFLWHGESRLIKHAGATGGKQGGAPAGPRDPKQETAVGLRTIPGRVAERSSPVHRGRQGIHSDVQGQPILPSSLHDINRSPPEMQLSRADPRYLRCPQSSKMYFPCLTHRVHIIRRKKGRWVQFLAREGSTQNYIGLGPSPFWEALEKCPNS